MSRRRVRCAEDEDVGAIVAGQDVVTASAFDGVRRVPADHGIGARVAEQPVTGVALSGDVAKAR
jgi:hypothetical protein